MILNIIKYLLLTGLLVGFNLAVQYVGFRKNRYKMMLILSYVIPSIILWGYSVHHMSIPIFNGLKLCIIIVIPIIMISCSKLVNWLYRYKLSNKSVLYLRNKKFENNKVLSINLLVSILLAPIMEELFFRGIILNGLLCDTNSNVVISILYSATLFSITHLRILAILDSFIGGIILGIIYYMFDDLLMLIVIHSLYNTISIIDKKIY